MSDQQNLEYYQSREQRERDMAARVSDPHVASIHHELADRYAAYLRWQLRPKRKMVGSR
ncbi:hypothetical protein [Sphingomonas sp. PB4P5]|uniref:hypothetical protein n=1 Tax=Parasphingomonas puruogangriensis TaxID=3096155 RepID=UPI002FCA5969